MDGLSTVPLDAARIRNGRSSTLSRYIKPEHKRMSRMLGYCLTLGTEQAWRGFSMVAAVRLTPEERAALAFAALQALQEDHAELAATAALDAPQPAPLGGMATARAWAVTASRAELKAMIAAAYDALSAEDRAKFCQHIAARELAA